MPTSYTTPEADFLSRAHAGQNVFLTGMAGTGKSYTLRQFIREASDGTRNGELNLSASFEPRKVDVTAPTGVAALNVGGMTVHRWAGILLGPKPGESFEACARRLEADGRPSLMAGRRRVCRAECLVIDEISMLPGSTFDFLEFWMRRQRGNDRPFGGCHVIVVGDFLQLPPVRVSDGAPYDWAFSAQAWAAGGFQQVTLTTVRRQDEPAFVRALGDFRRGMVTGESGRVLQARVQCFPKAELVRILATNLAVDKWNRAMLEDLDGEEAVYQAETGGNPSQIEFLTKNLLTPAELRLKEGARVMFTRNDTAQRWVNGTVGKVLFMEPGRIDVEVDDRRIAVEPAKWQYDSEDESSAYFKQFPLRLAYAMTIHKSQGATLDGAHVDIRSAREPGQAYVAISRVRTLAGLSLKEWPRGVFVSNEAMKFYS